MYFIAFKQQEAHFSQFSGPSFFIAGRGSKGLSSRHDLLVDEAGNFGQFEFFPEKKKGRAMLAQADWLQGGLRL